MSRFIQIVEVGPRDGLQNEEAVLEPAVRAGFVRRLEAAGARRIEAVSFVHPKYVPQMAGAEAVMADLPPEAGRSRIGLVLNAKGYDLFGPGHLGHVFRMHEADRLDATRAGRLQPPHEAGPHGGLQHGLFVLEAVAGTDLDDLDEAAHWSGSSGAGVSTGGD